MIERERRRQRQSLRQRGGYITCTKNEIHAHTTTCSIPSLVVGFVHREKKERERKERERALYFVYIVKFFGS